MIPGIGAVERRAGQVELAAQEVVRCALSKAGCVNPSIALAWHENPNAKRSFGIRDSSGSLPNPNLEEVCAVWASVWQRCESPGVARSWYFLH
jgi:hypothetical protein